MRRIAYAAVAGLVVAGIVAAVVLAGGGGDEDTNRLTAAAGCERLQSPAVLPSDHIAPPERATYNTNPPTSGKHYNAAGAGPITTGIHRSAVQYEGSVHNLEHGHIVIYYKESVGPAVANTLAEVVRADSRWRLLAPNPDMPFQVAFTAWGKLIGCNEPREAGLKALGDHFADRFQNKAPETVPGTPEPGTDTATPPAAASPTATSTAPSPSPTGTSP